MGLERALRDLVDGEVRSTPAPAARTPLTRPTSRQVPIGVGGAPHSRGRGGGREDPQLLLRILQFARTLGKVPGPHRSVREPLDSCGSCHLVTSRLSDPLPVREEAAYRPVISRSLRLALWAAPAADFTADLLQGVPADRGQEARGFGALNIILVEDGQVPGATTWACRSDGRRRRRPARRVHRHHPAHGRGPGTRRAARPFVICGAIVGPPHRPGPGRTAPGRPG